MRRGCAGNVGHPPGLTRAAPLRVQRRAGARLHGGEELDRVAMEMRLVRLRRLECAGVGRAAGLPDTAAPPAWPALRGVVSMLPRLRLRRPERR